MFKKIICFTIVIHNDSNSIKPTVNNNGINKELENKESNNNKTHYLIIGVATVGIVVTLAFTVFYSQIRRLFFSKEKLQKEKDSIDITSIEFCKGQCCVSIPKKEADKLQKNIELIRKESYPDRITFNPSEEKVIREFFFENKNKNVALLKQECNNWLLIDDLEAGKYMYFRWNQPGYRYSLSFILLKMPYDTIYTIKNKVLSLINRDFNGNEKTLLNDLRGYNKPPSTNLFKTHFFKCHFEKRTNDHISPWEWQGTDPTVLNPDKIEEGNIYNFLLEAFKKHQKPLHSLVVIIDNDKK